MPMPERGCPGCPHKTPVVSLPLVQRLVASLDREQQTHALGLCVDWLTRKHLGIDLQLGHVKVPYAWEERVAVATEVWRVADLPCPFHSAQGCVLRGYTTPVDYAQEEGRGSWSWLPTYLLRCMNRSLLRDLFGRGLIPDAKVATLRQRSQFPVADPGRSTEYLVTSPERKKEVTGGRLPEVVQPGPD